MILLQTSLTSTLVFLLGIVLVYVQSSQWASNAIEVSLPNQCSTNATCPTWFICKSGKNCECGDEHDHAIVCDPESLASAVLDCHCVTYDGKAESTYLGSCFYNCENYDSENRRDSIYTKLPKTPTSLDNNSACTYFHRTGLLCGDCEDGHSPLVLSYNLSCVKCPDGHKNWWKFILVAFVPLTFFYFFVVVFNINVTSSRLHGVVWFSQALTSPICVRLIMITVSRSSPKYITAMKVMLSFYDFWNLNILRMVLPDVCLNVTTLQALALDYLVALYPFVLILFSYIIIELYDRKCICIVALWKPFQKILTPLKKSWNIRTSVIDSFATFILLSYVKFANVSFDLLVPTQIYQLGSNKSTLGLFYSPSVAYFGHEHLPYALVAIAHLMLFVIAPTAMLILYPFQFFQKFLSLFPFNWHFLRAFVDAYQGCYKDGTDAGTLDCRWFASLALIIQLILLLIWSSTLSIIFFAYAIIALTIYLIALINIQPFKSAPASYPSTDTVFITLLSLCYVAAIERGVANTQSMWFRTVMIVVILISAFIPIAYTVTLIGFWVISRARRVAVNQ